MEISTVLIMQNGIKARAEIPRRKPLGFVILANDLKHITLKLIIAGLELISLNDSYSLATVMAIMSSSTSGRSKSFVIYSLSSFFIVTLRPHLIFS